MCGTVAVMAKDDSPDAPALRGLEAWAAFPADRDPRPVVLLDMIPPVYLASSPVGQARLALLHGAVEAVPGFPAAVLEAVCGQPGEYAGPPLEGVRGQPDDYAGPPLLLTGAVLGSFRYETDRGPRYLPAWDVRVEGISPIKVLDPAVIASGQVWEPAGRRRNENLRPTVTVGADDRTLTMTYNGSGWYAASDQPPARTLEQGNAAALIFTEKLTLPENSKPGRRGFHARVDVGRTRQVTAVLSSPLGDRVLLDATGRPFLVTPEHQA
jgi:hypothetical protein